jgi:VIT1/CCC1 family predicted Fe2+/Mn2+ transporter
MSAEHHSTSVHPGRRHHEHHAVQHIGWLRAAVLGGNDGVLSTASLIVGVAGAGASHSAILLSGCAALIAGATSMAVGEYVSVSSQADLEAADLAREAAELEANPVAEQRELAGIYVARGVSRQTAESVARELTAHDALAAHAQDELGLANVTAAQPFRAAVTSALAFAAGASLPLATILLIPGHGILPAVIAVTLVCLAILGGVGAVAGRAPVTRGVLRVVGLGAVALLVTTTLGHLMGTVVG